MLRILFVALTENETMRGVERYALELVRALALHHGAELQITILCGEWQRYFEELTAYGVKVWVAPVRNSKHSRHGFLLTRMRRLSASFDLVHYGNLLPIAIPNKVPSTMTIHDVAEYALSGKYGRLQRFYRKLVGWRAARSIVATAADSHFTRDEIVRYLGVDRRRISVIYPGVDHFRRATEAPLPTLPSRYFLYYGVIEETKGADTAILAFRRLLDEGGAADTRLVLIGKPGNAYSRLAPLIDGDRVIHLGYMDDAALQQYISRALAVVFVSRYEGFGLPAVESYMLNDTVIASRGNAVGEVSRGFAFQVDETSVDALTLALREVLAGRQPRPRLSRAEVEACFSWDEAARRMLALFQSAAVARKPPPEHR